MSVNVRHLYVDRVIADSDKKGQLCLSAPHANVIFFFVHTWTLEFLTLLQNTLNPLFKKTHVCFTSLRSKILHGGGSGLRLNDGFNVKLEVVG